MGKKFLVVVDMQNDFIDGTLGTKEAQTIVPKVVELVNNFDGMVIATLDTHEDNYLETQEGTKLPIEHCIYKSEGWFPPNELKQAIESKPEFAFELKETFGSFDIKTKINQICEDDADVEEITLVGVCTGICVISNALILKSQFPEAKINVIEDLCACVTPESHKHAIETMKMCQINVI